MKSPYFRDVTPYCPINCVMSQRTGFFTNFMYRWADWGVMSQRTGLFTNCVCRWADWGVMPQRTGLFTNCMYRWADSVPACNRHGCETDWNEDIHICCLTERWRWMSTSPALRASSRSPLLPSPRHCPCSRPSQTMRITSIHNWKAKLCLEWVLASISRLKQQAEQ
jgi:hypothetical protein